MVIVAADHPVRRRVLGRRRADARTSSTTTSRSTRPSRSPSSRRAESPPGLGPPDILFFALFLATTVRWRLRPGWTWLAMTAMYSLTLVLANATDVNGLPALPFLSVGFLLANGDLLWRRLRPRQSLALFSSSLQSVAQAVLVCRASDRPCSRTGTGCQHRRQPEPNPNESRRGPRAPASLSNSLQATSRVASSRRSSAAISSRALLLLLGGLGHWPRAYAVRSSRRRTRRAACAGTCPPASHAAARSRIPSRRAFTSPASVVGLQET